jgi:putative aldouronate transport system permease protein
LSLFYAVVHWNRYFDALIFLKSEHLWNLQLVLRNIIMSAARLIGQEQDIGNAMLIQEQTEVMKYAVIVFAAVPVMLLYPFVQRYFIKGIMIGSLKG